MDVCGQTEPGDGEQDVPLPAGIAGSAGTGGEGTECFGQ